MSKGYAFQKLKEIYFKNAASAVPAAAATILSGILYGVEDLIEKAIPCPCDLQLNVRDTVLAFFVPTFSLFLISLLVLLDARKVVTCRVSFDSPSTCRCQSLQTCLESCFSTCIRKFYFFLYTLLKVSLPSILCVVIRFADGDYYACAHLTAEKWKKNIQNCNASCASIPKLIPSELSKLCLSSQIIGGVLLVLTPLMLVVLHFLPGCICSEEQQATGGQNADDAETGKPTAASNSRRRMGVCAKESNPSEYEADRSECVVPCDKAGIAILPQPPLPDVSEEKSTH